MIINVTGIALLAYMDGVKADILGSVMVTTGSAITTAIYKVLINIIKSYLLIQLVFSVNFTPFWTIVKLSSTNLLETNVFKRLIYLIKI